MADIIPPVPDDPSFNFIIRNWLFKMRYNVNLFAKQISTIVVDLANTINPSNKLTSANLSTYVAPTSINASVMNVSQLSAIAADLGTITAGEVSIGSSPARSGTTMTGSGAHFYSDGKFSIGKAAQNLTYDGSDLYLNGFYANNNLTYTASTVYSGAAVNFATKSFTGGGEYVQTTLQKATVLTSFNGALYVQINTATSYMLSLQLVLYVERWNGSSWVASTGVASITDTKLTGTDTSVAYAHNVSLNTPITIPSFVAGSLYRLYPQAVVSCSTLAGALATVMTTININGVLTFTELKI